jgi:hypothetical protein
LSALFVLLLGANPALAYAGPGVDVSFISSAMALLAWALAAGAAVFLWPVYALLRKIRGRKDEPTTTPATEAAPEEARAVSHTDA